MQKMNRLYKYLRKPPKFFSADAPEDNLINEVPVAGATVHTTCQQPHHCCQVIRDLHFVS